MFLARSRCLVRVHRYRDPRRLCDIWDTCEILKIFQLLADDFGIAGPVYKTVDLLDDILGPTVADPVYIVCDEQKEWIIRYKLPFSSFSADFEHLDVTVC